MATLTNVTFATGILAAAAMAGCGGATPEATGPVDNQPAGSSDFAVWHGSGKDARTNFYGPTGTLIKTVDGIFLLNGDQEWRVDYQEKEVPSAPCDLAGTSAGEAGMEQSSIAAMTLVGTRNNTSTRTLIDHSTPPDTGWLQQSITLRSSLGPALLLTEADSTYTCGAHGNLAVQAVAIDLATSAPIAIPGLNPELDFHTRAVGVAEVTPDGSTSEENPVSSITMFRPVVRADGSVGTLALVVVETDYASSAGEWSSYTTSTWVEVPDGNVTWPDVPALPAAVLADITSGDVTTPSGLSWGNAQ